MKNPNSFLNNTKFGLDKNVITTFLVMVVASIGILGFKLSKKQACTAFAISSASVSAGKTTVFFVGDPVVFVAASRGSQEILWDFGDNTPSQSGNNAKHIYTRDGGYTVLATVNGECVENIQVRIKPLPPMNTQAPETVAINPITGQDAPTANMPVIYTSSVKAGKYEWNILNSPAYPTQQTEVANYNFSIAGNLIIELKLDGDPTKVYRKQITVLPAKALPTVVTPPSGGTSQKPPPPIVTVQEPVKKDDPATTVVAPPVEVKKEKLIIADAEFRMKFEAVQRGEIDAAAFNDFLCDGASTRVLVENKGKEWQTVATICTFFSKNKKVKHIYDVSTERDAKNCVTLIHLKYKTSGFLGL